MAASPPYAPPQSKKGMSGCAIAAIVTGVAVVLIGGPLAVLAISGVRRYQVASKQVEARNSLGVIAKDAAAKYDQETEVFQPQMHVEIKRVLCASASQSVPRSAASIRGVKYASAPADWEVDKDDVEDKGFYCLRFSLDAPQYYQYAYTSSGGSSPGGSFTASAHGDLNGDGVLSTFSLTGQVGADDELAVAPNLVEVNPEE